MKDFKSLEQQPKIDRIQMTQTFKEIFKTKTNTLPLSKKQSIKVEETKADTSNISGFRTEYTTQDKSFYDRLQERGKLR